MSELSVADLIQRYALPKQTMTNFLMELYGGDENFFQQGNILLPIVTLVGRSKNRQLSVDERALGTLESLYRKKTGQVLCHRKPHTPEFMSGQSSVGSSQIRKR